MTPLLREAIEVWPRLFLYESRDQTARLFFEKHGRELTAQKAREINSAFAQGREYFEAAAAAGELVNPLVQYYGVLALARGAILFAKPEFRERSLSQSHGLRVVGWDGIDSGESSRLHELRLKTTPGTFSELSHATTNRELQYLDADIAGQVIGGTVFINKPRESCALGTELEVNDLLRRIPALSDLYEEVFGANSACHAVDARLKATGTAAEVLVHEGRDTAESLRAFMQLLRFSDNAQPKQVTDPKFFGHEPHFIVHITGSDQESIVASLPPVQRLPATIGLGERMFMIEPFPSGLALSPLLTLFGVSFLLGMLVRYHPSVWRTMLNREKGDFLYPLFRSLSHVIQVDYPRLTLQELEN